MNADVTRRLRQRSVVQLGAILLVGGAVVVVLGLVGSVRPAAPALSAPAASHVDQSTTLRVGISSAQAQAIAKEHVPADATLVSEVAGRFADVATTDVTSTVGAGYPIRPVDLVWAVSFNRVVDICQPDGSSCFTTRAATNVVFLDYATGDFRSSATYAPPP